ncbi:uncharacterized protein LOC128883789 [Hylaeus volcanicus]|uniref:uncharacterized protein LOC128883789 n=1 Tax=Hylaeus volcanicus TaxID=313075 RepID=UPI0023B82280|nr:uncharacterized protein LOC128883789 [Hylaeus volcanicus]
MGCMGSKRDKVLGIPHGQQNPISKDSYATLPDKLITSNTSEFQSTLISCSTPEPTNQTFPTNRLPKTSSHFQNIYNANLDALNDYEKINEVLSDNVNTLQNTSDFYSSDFTNYPTLLRNTASILNTTSSTMRPTHSTDHYRFTTEGTASISCKHPNLNILHSFFSSHMDLPGYNVAAKFQYINQSFPYNSNNIISAGERTQIFDECIEQESAPVIKVTNHFHLSCKTTRFDTKFKRINYRATDFVDCIDLCERTSPRTCLTKFIYILPEANCEISHLSSFPLLKPEFILQEDKIEKRNPLKIRQRTQYLNNTAPLHEIGIERKISYSTSHQDNQSPTHFLTLPHKKSLSVESLQPNFFKIQDEKYNLAEIIEPDVIPAEKDSCLSWTQLTDRHLAETNEDILHLRFSKKNALLVNYLSSENCLELPSLQQESVIDTCCDSLHTTGLLLYFQIFHICIFG